MTDASAKRPTIGFVGLGAMGWPMAACLVRAGFVVIGHDARNGVGARFAAEMGAVAAESINDIGARADVVITMLPNSSIVNDVLFGEGALAARLRPGVMVIEMSSGVPSATRDIGERLMQRGIKMIDAPVSGGVKRAKSADLAIMAGGAEADIASVVPILNAMGRSVMRTGELGSGQAMKALNNLVSAAGFLVGVEAMLIGKKAGLDPAVMVDVLNASSGRNNSTDAKFKQFVLSRSFDSGFSLDLMVKDLGIALDVAHEGRAAAPFSALCRELWGAAATQLGVGQDHTAVARFSEQLAGIRLEH